MSSKLPNHCGTLPGERNRFFTGKFMTARDFAEEQAYFQGLHRFHSRMFHGFGIVCGLGVVEHPNPDCRPGHVVVKAGLALDCCGREICLSQDKALAVPADKGAQLLLCLRYGEEEIELVPSLYGEGGSGSPSYEANRIREVAAFEFVPLEDAQPGCWQSQSSLNSVDYLGIGSCITPDCPCGEYVPLALLTLESGPGGTKPHIRIDSSGRRRLPAPSHLLTHVAGINWIHGGEISEDRLRYEMHSELRIQFDRSLQPANGHATGINPETFVVQLGGILGPQEPREAHRFQGPWLDESNCQAVYPIVNNFFGKREHVGGVFVYVTLKCDFLLDCNNIPVDGNHLGGCLPSGDGRPGGDFVSWFRVKGYGVK